MTTGGGLVLGTVVGLLYWVTRAKETQRAWVRAQRVPTHADCTYLAAPFTDLAAFVGGAYCVVRGTKKNEPLVAAFGTAVVVIHTLQYVKHKT